MVTPLNFIEIGISTMTIYFVAIIANTLFIFPNFFIEFFTSVLIVSVIMSIIGMAWCGKEILQYYFKKEAVA